MKKTLLIAAGLLLAVSAAQAQLLTAFSFNDAQASGSTANATTFASTAGQSSTISTNFPAANVVVFAGTTTNAYNGDAAGNALSVVDSTDNQNDYIQFSVSSLNYVNLTLSYATRYSSAAACTTQTLSYSTDGSTYTPFATQTVGSTTFTTQSATLPSAAANQAALTIRIAFTGGTGTTTSNNRIDNIQLNNAAVPEPSTYACMALGILGTFATLRLRRHAA